MSREVIIASAVRTPIGSFGGAFKDVTAVDLGITAVKSAIERAGIKAEDVNEVIYGCVLQGGLGQNVARQVSIGSGIPIEVPSYTINKVCGSGLKTVSLAYQAILAGDADVIVVGGTESMTRAPYLLPTTRWGQRMGNGEIVDYMVNDGLTDVFNHYHMGITAENVAEKYGITKEMQDEFAVQSQNKAEKAVTSGRFKEEIVPVVIPQRKGDPKVVDTDEYPKFGTTIDALAKLKPAFKRDGGTVSAGNASGINDGAAALVVMSKEYADKHGIKPLVTILSHGEAGVDPTIMGTGPIPASRKAMAKLGITIKDIDLVEANEAFAAQALAVAKDLELDPEKTNVNGGAIALGHPIGASGARILVTLIHEMIKRDSKKGLATLCIGGGQGVSLIVGR